MIGDLPLYVSYILVFSQLQQVYDFGQNFYFKKSKLSTAVAWKMALWAFVLQSRNLGIFSMNEIRFTGMYIKYIKLVFMRYRLILVFSDREDSELSDR